ncbi:hypothetical protein C7N43_35555 [Sphingobacteriales bacterium UPWRP_1]|nr:hypothetical protein B6N25_10780 [Sphingobacteriales bacterium TSM_CSS]PSJ72182.1 hypothetical protein C7N43_35555 [Sphingobacteriales bacterium UPWRP_1]
MKKFTHLFFLLFAVVTMASLAGCNDDDDNNNNNNNPTNSVEAKIATDANLTNPDDWKSASVTAVLNNGVTTITAVGTDGSQLTITLPDDATGTYNLSASGGAGVIYMEDPIAAGTNPNLIFYGIDGSGSVAITKFDKTNKKISGTFQFQAMRLLSGVRRYFTLGEITDITYTE